MNRLAKEKSPYLLQHKDNPVDWYPWSEEAFSKAQELDRPIFLSIGYSTCHWCHVMEHESFEDEQIAGLMNSAFVNIKVDREERPDLDNIYMDVCRMLTGGGGWPLTIIMTPDKKPFFAGTYYPKESHYNRIGMIELVPKIQELWQTRKNDLVESAEEITSRIAGLSPSGDIPDRSILETAFSNFIANFDTHYGGFGSAPKFPMPHNYSFLIRHWKNSNDPIALQMIEKSLSEMRMGGIFDQLGGGFHRYSTDDKWLVPHFEKMLYDQALLAIAYTEVYQATGNEFYKKVASEILDYVQRDMTTDRGAFCTAEDADSEGIEGKHYNWSLDEVKWILGDDSEEFIANYNVTSEGNFVDPHYPEIKGMNILNLSAYSMDKIESMKISRDKLLAIRGERIRPLKDDKVLTDWNGLMIAAFAKAGFAFNNDPYKQTARNAADFIIENMIDPDNNLYHRWREGERAYRANLDDYAFLCHGLIELYSSIFEPKYLKKAIELTDKMIDLFSSDNGAFYFSSAEANDLIARNQEFYDGAIPSGNSIAMMNILKLWKYTGKESYRNKAESIAKVYAPQISKYPGGFSAFLSAFDFMTGASAELVIVEGAQGDSKEMIEIVRSGFYPNLIVTLVNDTTIDTGIKNILPIVNSFLAIDNKTTAYLCRNFACERPVNDIEELKKMLS